jgi:hypothetical protein
MCITLWIGVQALPHKVKLRLKLANKFLGCQKNGIDYFTILGYSISTY